MVFSALQCWWIVAPLLAKSVVSGHVWSPAANLKGIAEAGADLQWPSKDLYTFPKDSSIKHFATLGFGVVRIPFRWERLQPHLGGDFNQTFLASLKHTVNVVNKASMKAVLVPQNWARYCINPNSCPGGSSIGNWGGVIGEPNSGVTVEDFRHFWMQLATEFKENENVIFNIMEEPNKMSTKLWADTAQKAIHAIRDTNATQLVLVPGNGWTNAITWCHTSPDTDHKKISNAEAFMTFKDPADNFAFEMHQYLGPNGAPDLHKCGPESVGKDALKEATEWLEQNNFRGFLGEFGAPANSLCEKVVDTMLTYMDEHPKAWMGWTAWAAGSSPSPWWAKYSLNIEPDADEAGGLKDKPQTTWLRRHLGPAPAPTPPSPVPTRRRRRKEGPPAPVPTPPGPAPTPHCPDISPLQLTCAHLKKFGKCHMSWMKGHCCNSCFQCHPSCLTFEHPTFVI